MDQQGPEEIARAKRYSRRRQEPSDIHRDYGPAGDRSVPAPGAGLPLIILAFMVLGVILMPAANGLSRRFERQADAFELRLVRQPEAAISTFEKLARQNLADPSPHPLIVFLLYSHPPIAERVAMARAYEKR